MGVSIREIFDPGPFNSLRIGQPGLGIKGMPGVADLVVDAVELLPVRIEVLAPQDLLACAGRHPR